MQVSFELTSNLHLGVQRQLVFKPFNLDEQKLVKLDVWLTWTQQGCSRVVVDECLSFKASGEVDTLKPGASARQFKGLTSQRRLFFPPITGRVLKLVWNKTKAAVVGGFVLMEREWAIGRRLNLLNEEDGFLEGFTQTGSKILDKDGSFLGTVLEKLNGKGAKNRLEDPKFNDIDYIP
jgi:hypothetical protein